MDVDDHRVTSSPGPTPVGSSEVVQRILGGVERVIVGQERPLRLILAALLSGGHVLLEDRPGVGKTVLARALANTLSLDMQRIQGTPDLLPTDVTGIHVYNPAEGTWPFRAGPIFASLLLVDEFNRATPKAQSALLEAMAEGQVTVDGTTTPLPTPFMVIATQNPRGEVGTHPLVSAQLDRFAVMVRLGLPGRESERAVVEGRAGIGRLDSVQPVVDRDEVLTLMAEVASLPIAPSLVDYILDLVDAVRGADNEVWLSVRVPRTVATVARGHALVSGRAYVAPEDVQAVVAAALAHRLPSHFDEESVDSLVEAVPIPVHGS